MEDKNIFLKTIQRWERVNDLNLPLEEQASAWKEYTYSSGVFHRPVCDRERLFEHIRKKLSEMQPFFCGRLGATEQEIAGEYIEKRLGLREKYSETTKKWLLETSGFFVENEEDEREIDKYARMTLDACGQLDILLVWGSRKYYAYIANTYCSNAILATKSVQPYDEKLTSWAKGLAGKRVLVVSAFSKSIEYQYGRKKYLCRNSWQALPDFELKTYQMLQTQCGNRGEFVTWFDAYECVRNQVLDIDFDVAIVGAGAYGFPLCADIKKAGRSAIELCGFTPMMFGIVGQRHIDAGELDKYGTDAWIRPLETPPDYYKRIEGGCYW